MTELDFSTPILLEGTEVEVEFNTLEGNILDGKLKAKGTLKLKQKDGQFKPDMNMRINKRVDAWMRTHHKYWRIVCGLEQADTRTNIKIMGMLLRADLNELAAMVHIRIDEMMVPMHNNDSERTGSPRSGMTE